MRITVGHKDGKRNYQEVLFCSDFDGTMTVDAKISTENAEAIRYFQSEGGIFIVASDREPSFFRSYCDIFSPNAPVIGYNGLVIADSDVNIYIFFLQMLSRFKA